MSDNLKDNILLIGAGQMAYDYAKVLESFQLSYSIICRSINSADKLSKKINKNVYSGGVENFLERSDIIYKMAIIAVGVGDLSKVARILIKNAIKDILIEKPGGIDTKDIASLAMTAKKSSTNIYVAYNRRFYSSTIKAREIINKDGGLKSFKFDFSEWSSVVTSVHKNEDILRNWFLINSSHVIDLAFFVGGVPIEITSYNYSYLSWHPSGSVFTGSGITNMDIPFSYHANWNSPGRWSIEFFTKRHRVILCPLEELKIQNHKSLIIKKVEIDSSKDTNYKPGLYLQVLSFINDKNDLVKIEDHANSLWYYLKINGNK